MVIARPVTGKYRTIKNRISVVLFAIFLITPFIRIDGIPLVLLDIPARKFFIFGLTIWPQELYFLHILLLSGGFLLFAVTALFGRIWCGYACPQTLFTEIYDRVARVLTGNRYGKPDASKAVWAWVYFVWAIMSIAFSYVFLAYFKPYEEIIRDIVQGNFLTEGTLVPAPWVIFMILSVGAAWGNMAYFRENMCRLICPYGRFQTALLDGHSPIVSYNVNRGEPRRDKKTQKVGQHKGDCIDCGLCTLVCPTGIDIREGLQIGCLSCGLCVDACTTVMGKLKKETLIDYRTIEQVTDPSAKIHYLRGRTAVYGVILTILVSAFVFLLVKRVPIYANAVRDKAIISVHIPGTGWQNGYEIHVGNLSHHDIDVRIDPEEGSPYTIIRTDDTLHISAGGYERIRYIVQYPESLGRPVANAMPIIFTVTDMADPNVKKVIKSTFTFPY